MNRPNYNHPGDENYDFSLQYRNSSASTEHGDYDDTGVSIVRNIAQWVIESGEIARWISPDDFANLDNVAGILIQDGVSAIIQIDGKEVTKLDGGLYKFITDEEINALLDQYAIDQKFISRAYRWLIKVLYRKNADKNSDALNSEITAHEAIRHLNENSLISVYLKADRKFPSIYGYDRLHPEDPFTKMNIRAKNADVQIAVSMLMQITDFRAFIREYMLGRKSVMTTDIQSELNYHVYSILTDELQNEVITESGIAPAVRDRIAARLKSLETYMQGIAINQVVSITCDNDDFERFRELSKELYCSERELDFLRRSNEFRNRLASVKNEQSIIEARTDLEQIKLLDEINRDGLLQKEEMDRFMQSLDIRREEAEADRESASLRIQLSRFRRVADHAKAKLDIETSLTKQQIQAESGIEDEKFAAWKRQQARTSETLDIESTIYGKTYLIEKQKLEDSLSLDDISLTHKHNTVIKEARMNTILTEEELNAQSLVDDYKFKAKVREEEFLNRQEDERIERLRKEQQISLSALEQLTSIKDNSADKAHQRELENKQLDIRLRMAELDVESRKTPEQIMAAQIGSMSGEAAATFAASFSAKNAAEAAAGKRESDLIREQAQREAAMYERMLKFQQEQTDKMMDFTSSTMNTNTSIIQGEREKDDERSRQELDRLERLSSQRLTEIKEQKEEYREQMMHEQMRTDQNQDKALNYTARITETGLKQNHHPKEDNYCVEQFGPAPFSFEQIRSLILNGVIKAESIIVSNGEKRTAISYPEFRTLFGQN